MIDACTARALNPATRSLLILPLAEGAITATYGRDPCCFFYWITQLALVERECSIFSWASPQAHSHSGVTWMRYRYSLMPVTPVRSYKMGWPLDVRISSYTALGKSQLRINVVGGLANLWSLRVVAINLVAANGSDRNIFFLFFSLIITPLSTICIGVSLLLRTIHCSISLLRRSCICTLAQIAVMEGSIARADVRCRPKCRYIGESTDITHRSAGATAVEPAHRCCSAIRPRATAKIYDLGFSATLSNHTGDASSMKSYSLFEKFTVA